MEALATTSACNNPQKFHTHTYTYILGGNHEPPADPTRIARGVRARFAMPFTVINLHEMYKEVLAWDLYKMLEGNPMYSLNPVPLRFSSIDEYLDIFEPLLLEECRAQTLRHLYAAAETEHRITLASVEAAEPFRLLHFELPPHTSDEHAPFESKDLVFISHEQLHLEDIHSHGRVQEFHALGLVEKIITGTAHADILILKVYLRGADPPCCRPHLLACLLACVRACSLASSLTRLLRSTSPRSRPAGCRPCSTSVCSSCAR